MIHSCRLAVLAGLLLTFILTTPGVAQNASIERRAAFDIGSAAIKCTIADVDTVSGHIVTVVDTLTRKVDFSEDMARSYDRNFSEEIMGKGLAALKELKALALRHGVRAFSAVGGAVFREARNGRAYFSVIKDETGIPSRVVSKQQASMLTYHAVRQIPDIPINDLLVWDIGGGSMEMTARNADGSLVFYVDKMASVSFKNVVISVIQEKDINAVSSPNPMSEAEVHRALEYVQSYVQMNLPAQLAGRIKSGSMNIVGIGGVHYYAVPELLGERKATYSRDEVKAALTQWTGAADEKFDSEYANTRLTNLILVLGYMNGLDIDSVTTLKVNQTEGLLVAPKFW